MGRFKEMMMDCENGLMHTFDKDKNVCAGHFKDKYLQEYISNNGHEGECSYCGKKNIAVMDMKSFLQYVEERLSQRLCSLDDANLPLASSFYDDKDEEIPGFCRAGNFILPKKSEKYENVWNLMCNYSLSTLNDELNSDIASCFNNEVHIQKDVFAENLDEKLSYAWDYFSKMVKYKKRYTFFHDSRFIKQEKWNNDVLMEINHLCGKILASKLPKGTLIFRGRPNETDIPRTSFKDLTAPPAESAKENRMSAIGISMFYGSFDKDTVIQEIRNYTQDAVIDLGEFELKKDLMVIDLCRIPEHLSFWMPKHFMEYKFLKKFHMEITKPIDNPGIEYVPTQIFTEYIRFMNNYHFNGII